MSRFQPHRVFVVVTVLSGVILFGVTSAQAEGIGLRGWGVRGGLSSDPDQFVLGMHADMGEFAENLRFTPNADIGFGDDLTVFTLNPDVTYVLPLPEAGKLYFGGTLSLIYLKLDVPEELENLGVDIDDSDTDVGVAGIIGYQPPTEGLPIFFDLKLGISDEYPDLKVMLGYDFNRN